MKIETFETKIEGVKIIRQEMFEDRRGSFVELFHPDKFKAAGLPELFVQINQSFSEREVLRGLHIQRNKPMGKLVRCLTGTIQDVWLDCREGSPTFGKYETIRLTSPTEDEIESVYIPPGLAHGFLVLSDQAVIQYSCTTLYDQESDGGILWNDPAIEVEWEVAPGYPPLMSDKDRRLPTLAQWMEGRNQ